MATAQSSAATTHFIDPHLVLVRFDRVYGRVVCYPVSDAAFALSDLTKTKTLAPGHLTLARKLGLRIALAPGSLAVLEDFIVGGAR